MSSTRRPLLLGGLALAGATAALALVLSGPATRSARAADPPAEVVEGTVIAPTPKQALNTVVWVKTAGQGTGSGNATIDQKGLVFLPRVLAIQKGTTVEFTNFDPVLHNVFSPDGEKYDLGKWPKGESRKYKFEKAGVYRQLCSEHKEMAAFVVVLDTKLFALADKDGKFKITGLPAGAHTLGIWNEKLGAKDVSVTVAAGKPASVTINLEKK